MISHERPREGRARVSLPTLYVRRNGAVRVEMVDASFRGLFVRMNDAPEVRQLLRLRITLPTRTLDVHGVVARVVPEPAGEVGVGLRFFALNGADRMEWESYVSRFLPYRQRAA